MGSSPPFPVLLTMEELAVKMSWHKDHVRHLHAQKRLPGARKIFGSVRVVQSEFLAAFDLDGFPCDRSEPGGSEKEANGS